MFVNNYFKRSINPSFMLSATQRVTKSIFFTKAKRENNDAHWGNVETIELHVVVMVFSKIPNSFFFFSFLCLLYHDHFIFYCMQFWLVLKLQKSDYVPPREENTEETSITKPLLSEASILCCLLQDLLRVYTLGSGFSILFPSCVPLILIFREPVMPQL